MSTKVEHTLAQGVIFHGPEILERCIADPGEISLYLDRIQLEHLDYPITKDKINIDNWLIPKEYKDLDIENFLYQKCPVENKERLSLEISLYKKNNMIMVLKAMKYLVDTLRSNNIIWGVGRGSSVASYVLYLIGVHKIDSVKYNLPIEEFFKGEQNG